MMNRSLAVVAMVTSLAGTGVLAESNAGANEFVQACASCHGVAGHGDGPLAEFMTVEVPDLTQMAAQNDGVFPMLQVIQVIDGRTGVRGHGSSMPIWGDRFQAQAALDAGDYGAEIIVRGRVLSLATHLEAIQE